MNDSPNNTWIATMENKTKTVLVRHEYPYNTTYSAIVILQLIACIFASEFDFEL